MNVLEKAKVWGYAGRYDSGGPKACGVEVNGGLGGVYYAKAEHKTCRLFKMLEVGGKRQSMLGEF
jgi:hypothetical protein